MTDLFCFIVFLSRSSHINLVYKEISSEVRIGMSYLWTYVLFKVELRKEKTISVVRILQIRFYLVSAKLKFFFLHFFFFFKNMILCYSFQMLSDPGPLFDGFIYTSKQSCIYF